MRLQRAAIQRHGEEITTPDKAKRNCLRKSWKSLAKRVPSLMLILDCSMLVVHTYPQDRFLLLANFLFRTRVPITAQHRRNVEVYSIRILKAQSIENSYSLELKRAGHQRQVSSWLSITKETPTNRLPMQCHASPWQLLIPHGRRRLWVLRVRPVHYLVTSRN